VRFVNRFDERSSVYFTLQSRLEGTVQ